MKMSEKDSDRIDGLNTKEDQKQLRNAVIIFAIIEALVIIPVVIYLILR
jgi:hypothetical protein